MLKRLKNQKGQSMTEVALIAPILIILFIGLFEVGWVLRGYVVLTNANREAARFAAKGEYLDFRESTPEEIGYDTVLAHALTSLSDQLAIDVESADPNGTIIISHFLVDTRQPCTTPPCDCAALKTSGGWYKYDDMIAIPSFPGASADWVTYSSLSQSYGDATNQSKFNDAAYLNDFVSKMVAENNEFNCQLSTKSSTAAWSPNSVVVVETYYNQSQLLGIPFISNSFTDPVTIYNQTTMRITPGEKEVPGCEVLPITIHEDNTKVPVGTTIPNIREGAGTGNFGWLRWRDGHSSDPTVTNANSNSAEYLEAALANPRLSVYDYQNAQNETDTKLNVGDWIWGLTGQIASAEGDVQAKIPGVYVIPVWDTATGTGSNLKYHIVGFAKFNLVSVDMNGNPKQITATFMGMDTSSCSLN